MTLRMKIKNQDNPLLKTSNFVLSAANITKLQSHWTVKPQLYQDVTKRRKHQNTVFTLTCHV